MKCELRVDCADSGQKFVWNNFEFIKLSSKQQNPLVRLSTEDGLCLAVRVDNGEVHAFSQQMVEVEGVVDIICGDGVTGENQNKEDTEENKED